MAHAAALDLVSLLPKSDAVAGWRTEGKVETYTRDNLYDYIDGGADFYLGYRFQHAAVADYTGPGSLKITVELYDMGASYDAFGVFANEPPAGNPRIGQGSSYAKGLLTFWEGQLFARIFAERESPQTRQAIIKFGSVIASRVSTAGVKPPLLQLLPRAGLAAKSVRYFHTVTALNHVLYLPGNPLQLDQTTQVAYGEYPQANDNPAKVVVVQYGTAERANSAFIALDQQLGGRGVPTAGLVAFHRTERYRWAGAVALGRRVGLVANAPDRACARRLIDATVVGIKKYRP